MAAKEDLTLPDSLDAERQGMVDELAALRGSAFDEAYIAAMVKSHKMDAQAFKAESAASADADIKNFVDKSLLVVQMHLESIQAMTK